MKIPAGFKVEDGYNTKDYVLRIHCNIYMEEKMLAEHGINTPQRNLLKKLVLCGPKLMNVYFTEET